MSSPACSTTSTPSPHQPRPPPLHQRHSVPASPTLSPASPNLSWDFSINQLSSSLSQICHSPTGSCGDISRLHGSRGNVAGSRRNDMFGSRDIINRSRDNIQRDSAGHPEPNLNRSYADSAESLPRSLSESASGSVSVSSPKERIQTQRSSESPAKAVVMGTTGRLCKKIRIRHEESRRRLNEQLALICKGKSRGGNGNQDLMSLQRPLLRRGSIANVFRLNVDITDKKTELLRVRVHKQIIQVIEIQGVLEKVLQSESLVSDNTGDVDPESLMCIFDAGVLKIKQYPNKYLKYEYVPNNGSERSAQAPMFLPIMQQDDAAGTWRMVVRIPGGYDIGGSGVSVKTLDNRLIIQWLDVTTNQAETSVNVTTNLQVETPQYSGDSSNSHSNSQICPKQEDSPILTNDHTDSISHMINIQTDGLQCRLSVDLPYTVVSRSVSGMMTEDDQLIVEALLGSRDRCFTL